MLKHTSICNTLQHMLNDGKNRVAVTMKDTHIFATPF
jgi:hypothetical protein